MRKTLRKLLAAMAGLCLAGALAAQTVPVGWVGISATNTRDAGIPIVNGTIAFQPVNNSGTPISFRSAGGTGAAATATFGIVIASQSPGSGYSGSWTCSVAGGTFTSAATCTATVSSGGLIFAITSAGAYTAPPTGITFSGGTFAPGVAATVSTSMTLSGTTVTAGGSGYAGTVAQFPGCTGTITSAVTISSGAVTAVSATGGSCPAGTPVVIVGSGQAGPDPWTATVTAGAFYIQVPDSVQASPVNVCYAVTITDNVTGNVQSGPGYSCVQPAGSGTAVTGGSAWCTAQTSTTGGTCNFDSYPPNLAALVVTQQGPTGPAGAAGAAGATGATGATGPLAPSGTPVIGHCANWASSTTIGDAGACGGGGGSSSGFSHATTAIQSVIANSGNMNLCLVGDSTFVGMYSNGASSGNWMPLSPSTQLANLMSAYLGIQATSFSFFGTGDKGSSALGYVNNYGGALALGTGWAIDTTNTSIGGPTYTTTTANTSSADALSYTPEGNVNTARIFYLKFSSSGTLSANFDGGTATTQSTSGSTGMGVLTITAGSVGAHTIYVTMSAGSAIWIVGMDTYDATQKLVHIERMGIGAALASDLASTTNVFSAGQSLPYSTVGCDLTIDEAGINDWQNAVSQTSFKASLQQLFTSESAAGSDVMFESPTPQNGTSIATMLSYVQSMETIAAANTNTSASLTVPFVNVWSLFSGPVNGASAGWGYANAYGWMYATDGIHPIGYGYAVMAQAMIEGLGGKPTAEKIQLQSPWLPLLAGQRLTLTNTTGVVGQTYFTATNGTNSLATITSQPGSTDGGIINVLTGGATRIKLDSFGGATFWSSNSTGRGICVGPSCTPTGAGVVVQGTGNNTLYYQGYNGTNTTISLHSLSGSSDAGQIDLLSGGTVEAEVSAYLGAYFNSTNGGVAIGTTTIPTYGLSISHNANNSIYLSTTNGTNTTLSFHSLSGSSDAGQIDWLYSTTVDASISAYLGSYFFARATLGDGGVAIGSTTIPNYGVAITTAASQNALLANDSAGTLASISDDSGHHGILNLYSSGSPTALISGNSATGSFVPGTFQSTGLIATAAAPTVSASQIGYGGSTAASSSCGSLTSAAGCVVINVAGTAHYIPYY